MKQKLALLSLASLAITGVCLAADDGDAVTNALATAKEQSEALKRALETVNVLFEETSPETAELGSWLRALTAQAISMTAQIEDIAISIQHGTSAERIRDYRSGYSS